MHEGLTIEQWRERIKLIDPADPQSAALVPGLIALVRDRDVPQVTRRQAAHTLGRIGQPAKAAVPVLIELLSEASGPGESTVFWSAKALALFGAEARDAAPTLIGILHDQSQPTADREAAIEALTRISTAHPRVLTTLVELLQKHSSTNDAQAATFRAHAAASLGLMGAGAASAVPALIRATRDESEPVRLQSVIALGAVGRQAEVAIPALVDSLLSDDAPSVRDE
ncbi:MAG: HEAT repeat domain-containing protein, partial [Planctomycetaceae bacterium]